MDLNKIGEFGLIKKLRHKIGRRSKNIKTGIGDDCAILSTSNCDLLATTDILIENIHFNLSYFSPEILGKKAIAVNLSDIAAMGGTPLYILISLGIPSSTNIEFIEKLYAGFENMSKKHNCSIVGGDISRSLKGLIISITIIGEGNKNRLVRRNGARVEDKIFVTGNLGDSAAGLESLKRNNRIKRQGPQPKGLPPNTLTKSFQNEKLLRCNSIKNKLIEKHLSPKPRLKEGQVLAGKAGVSAMIDISDGLASDLEKICEESKCGARIYLNKIPLSFSLRRLKKAKKQKIFNYALFGGEDYELLFTVKEKKIARLQKQWQKMKIPLSNIGEILDKKHGITLVYPDGEEVPLPKGGYDHFKNS